MSIVVLVALGVGYQRWSGGQGEGPIENERPARDVQPVGVQLLRALHAQGSVAGSRVRSIVGTVRSTEGAAVSDASVCVSAWNVQASTVPAVCVTSDPTGAFEFLDLGVGGYVVSASRKDFGAVSADQGQPVFLEARQEGPTRVDLVLPRDGVKLSGTVRDATGGTVGGAVVRATVFDPSLRLETVSGEEGDFAFWVPRGSTMLSAQAQGYSQVELARVAPSDDVELVLIPESRLLGQVVSARDGEPVPDITVSAAPLNNPYQQGAASVETDGAGEFALSGLQPGSYVLRARSAHWAGSYPQPVELELASTSRVLIMVQPAVRVSGRVLFDTTSEPCRTGTMMLGPWPDPMIPHGDMAAGANGAATPSASDVDAQTVNIDHDGTVVFDGMSEGRYHVVLRCMDAFLSEGPHVLDVGTEEVLDVLWKVVPSGELTVQTVDQSNTPVSNITVTLKYDTPGAPGRKAMTVGVTDSKGSFTFRGLLPGRYEVRANGGRPEDVVVADLEAGETGKQVRLELPGSGFILARVHAAGGAPVDGLTVQAQAEAAPDQGGTGSPAMPVPQGATRSLGDGSYRIGPLGAGRYSVVVHDGVNEPVEKLGVRVGSRLTTEVDVQVSRAGAIEGRVVDEEGAPLPNAWVTAAPDSNEPSRFSEGKRALTDLEGMFTLQRLDEQGVFQIRAEQSGGGVSVKRGVRCGQELEIVMASPIVVRGSVLDPMGQAVSLASVRVRHEETGAVRTQRVDENGGFTIRGVTPGALELWAFTPTGQHARLDLNLQADSKEALRVVLGEAAVPPSQSTGQSTVTTQEPAQRVP